MIQFTQVKIMKWLAKSPDFRPRVEPIKRVDLIFFERFYRFTDFSAFSVVSVVEQIELYVY